VSPAQRASAQVAALDQMASVGIGCVHECGGPDIAGEDDFTALLALDHPVERVGYWGELGGVDRARELGAVGAAGDLFVDGSIGSHTACLSAPYVDAADRGQSYLDVEQIAEHIRACTVAGMQAGFHAIGDGAVAAVTEGFSRVVEQLGAGPVREARHRVEHLEMVSAEQIAVLVRCGVVASVQPVFDARWGGADGMYVARLGAGRAAAMNPFRQMVAAGLELALGSDSPVTPPDPWAGVRAAVNHQTGSGISSAAAFAAHTSGGWLAARRDGNGDLAVGRPATFAAWQGASLVDGLPDLRESDPTCLATLVGGRIAYA
jgi:predicted amidohydrolase YtcJ